MNLIFAISADADKKSFVTDGNTKTISLVGLVTTETVAVQIPRVESPADDNDAHWTAMMQGGAAVELTADNNVVRVPARLHIRLVKAAGVAGNAYGVRWS